LGALAVEMPNVSYGSYPWFRSVGDNGVHLVASTIHPELIDTIVQRLEAIIAATGVTPERVMEDAG
jgi:hypothetical protein